MSAISIKYFSLWNNPLIMTLFDVFLNSGMKTEVTNIEVAKNEEVLGEGYIKGTLQTVENMGDVFDNAGVDLSNVEVIDWDTIKNDTASFVDDVISKARENVDLFNLFN